MAGKPPPGKGASLARNEVGHGSPVIKPHIPTAKPPPKRVPLPPSLRSPTPAPKPAAPVRQPLAPRATTPKPPPRTPKPQKQPSVRQVQRQLNRSGYRVKVDGLYGPETAAAIAKYNAAIPKAMQDARVGYANEIKTRLTEPQQRQQPIRLAPHQTQSVVTGHRELGSRTSYKPFYKGQTPDHYETRFAPLPTISSGVKPGDRKTIRVPVYTLKGAGAAGQNGLIGLGGVPLTAEEAQAQLGTTPTLAMRTLTGAVEPLTDLSQQALGEKKFQPGKAIKEAALFGSNFIPGLEGMAAIGGAALRGSEAARAVFQAVREGEDVAGAVRAAKVARDAKGSGLVKVPHSVRADAQAALAESQARTEIHAEIDAQVKAAGGTKAEAARVKKELDNAALDHAAQTGEKGTYGEAAQSYYDGLAKQINDAQPHGLAAPHSVDQQWVEEEIKNHGTTKNASMLPPGARDAKGLTRLVSELDARLRQGINVGKGWYARSGQQIMHDAGGNLDTADKLAALTAIYSPQQAVVPNIGLALRAMEQFRLPGGKVLVGQGWQRRAAEEVLNGRDWRAGMTSDQGLKIRSFYGNLLKHIDEGLMRARGYTGNEVTADGWIGAAFGYGHNTDTVQLSAKQYRFMERTIQMLAKHYGIEPEDAQAAIWMSIKAERDRGTRDLFLTDPASAIENSGSDFATGLVRPQHNVRFAFEASSSQKAWQLGLDEATLAQYTREAGQAVTAAFHEEGIPARLTDEGVGFYLNDAGTLETNPAVAIEVPVGTRPRLNEATGKADKSIFQAVTPEQQSLYDGLSAVINQGLHQEGGGWIRPLVSMSNSDHTAWKVTLGRQLSQDEMRGLGATIDHDNFYVTQTSDGFMVVGMNADDHLALAGKARQLSAQQAVDHVTAAIEHTFGPEAENFTLGGFTHRGGYTDQSSYEGAISSSGRPDLLQRLAGGIERNVAAVDARYGAPGARVAGDAGAPGTGDTGLGELSGSFDGGVSPPADPGTAAFDKTANADHQQFLDDVQAVIDQQNAEEPNASMGGFSLRKPRGIEHGYEPTTMSANDLNTQFLKPRSTLAQWGMRAVNKASKELNDTWVHDVPGLRLVTSDERVMKQAGRHQRLDAPRRTAEVARKLKAIADVKEGSLEDVAHFWYAQLPEAYRNGDGLGLIRAKQAERLKEIVSGEADAKLVAEANAIKMAMKEAEQGVGPMLQRLDEIKWQREDLPFEKKDVAASIAQFDLLLRDPPAVKQDVLDAMAELAARREEIIVHGDHARLDEEVAQGSRLKIADWLGIEGDGTESYVGHRLPRPDTQPYPGQPSGGAGRVKSPAGVGSKNRQILAANGRLRQSTRVAYEDWMQAAQVFHPANVARDELSAAGVPYKGGPFDSSKYVLINPKGKTIPAWWKTDELSQFGDDAVGREELRQQAKEIIGGFIADGESAAERQANIEAMIAQAYREEQSIDHLRLLPRRSLERYYKQFRSPGRPGAPLRAYDMAIDAVSTSIIFGRLGYIPKNVVQNLIMALPHQGAFLPVNAVRAAQVMADPELRALFEGTGVGGGGATAALNAERTVKKGLTTVTNFVVKVADEPMRTAAFLHEAAAEGVISRFSPILSSRDRERLVKLFTDKRQAARLNDIDRRMTEAMADFTRLTPSQARVARRFMVIPGWLMAGTRYPFHFALTHPIRTALMAYVAMGEPGAPNQLRFNDPLWHYLQGNSYLQGIDTGGWQAWGHTIVPAGRFRTSSISPISTPYDLIKSAEGSVTGKTGPFDYKTQTIFDVAQPIVRAGIGIAQGEGILKNLESLFPNYRFVHGLIWPKATTNYPGDDTWQGRLFREFGIIPIPVGGDNAGTGGGDLGPPSGSTKMPGSGGQSSFPGSGSGGGGFPG